MPTKSTVKVTRTKSKAKRIGISMAFEFDRDDPQAERLYRGIALLLREALTDEEAAEFLRKFEAERAKLAVRKGK